MFNRYIAIACLILISLYSCKGKVSKYTNSGVLPSITPDYVNVVIPPNIAPLNFYINNEGTEYHVDIYSKAGKKISIHQTSPKIQISIKDWRNLLEKNIGNQLFIDVLVKNDTWKKYTTITDSIVSDRIDPYLVYRLINGAYIMWDKMGIYQRNIENFDQTPIFENTSADKACVNCHMFSKNNPEKMQLHFRATHAGTMIKNGDVLKKINTNNKYTLSACAYPSWNPNGELIAYSVNMIRQNFTSENCNPQIVFDKASDVVVYDVKTNTIFTCPQLTTKNRENLPTWSPDGKWLYFISAPELQKRSDKTLVKYDLMRIAFDPSTYEFGKIDTVLTSKETGLSITFPVVSPDGKYILMGMADYGYFPVYNSTADLYIYEIETGNYRPMKYNSDVTDSYHSWASSAKWFVFSSKRMDKTYSRPFFCYIDSNGKEHKPFVLPQEDPLYYDTYLRNFNRPEMVTAMVDLNGREMRDLVLSEPEPVGFDSVKSNIFIAKEAAIEIVDDSVDFSSMH